VFGVSFTEFLVLGTVALLVLGPEKLPGMLRTMGHWIAKLRKLTTEVRHQSGIDEVLRAEGFDGGLNELRSIMRGGAATMAASHSPPVRQPVPDPFVADKSREYPAEGPDAYGALPEDLVAPLAPAPLELPEAGPTAIAALPVTTPAVVPALPSSDSPAATPALSGAVAPTPAQPSAEANTPSAPDPAAPALESPEATR
jgi:sec-independent protein translocase protein TatB